MTFHILFDRDGPLIAPEAGPENAPTVASIAPIVERLRSAQEQLREAAADDLVGLCDAAATAWARPGHPLSDLIRRHGLGFLLLWMRRRNLEATCAAPSAAGRKPSTVSST